jgi:membrane AbrB-like protein
VTGKLDGTVNVLSQWARRLAARPLIGLATLSVAFAALLLSLRLPAAVLLGCMAAAILLSVNERRVRVPAGLFVAAQGIVGCLIARNLQPSIMGAILADWPVFLATTISVIAASSVLGWMLMRGQVLPGTTAVWGLAPGAATAMVLMADSFGADMRLVAFMQYLRIIVVTVVASTISRLWTASTSASTAGAHWFPSIVWGDLGATLAVAMAGAALAWRLRIAAGAMLLPLVLGVALQNTGFLTIELPPVLLAAAYAIIGWSVGMRFTRPILVHAARALPRILLSIIVLIGTCLALAAVLTAVAGVDPLTAYLATSPGGADSIAIIAASSPVDVPFVMAMQLARFLLVLTIGPRISRLIAKRARIGRPPTQGGG